jgi:hypothetical protein
MITAEGCAEQPAWKSALVVEVSDGGLRVGMVVVAPE